MTEGGYKNANGQIRQYVPKKKKRLNMSVINKSQSIQRKLT